MLIKNMQSDKTNTSHTVWQIIPQTRKAENWLQLYIPSPFLFQQIYNQTQKLHADNVHIVFIMYDKYIHRST